MSKTTSEGLTARDVLRLYQKQCDADGIEVQVSRQALDEVLEEIEELVRVLQRHGFRRCDVPACNCGSWHHVDGLAARWREIDETTLDYWQNGETLLERIRRIVSLADDERANREAGEVDTGWEIDCSNCGETTSFSGDPWYRKLPDVCASCGSEKGLEIRSVRKQTTSRDWAAQND